jgi:hypothetical protein
MGNFYVSMTARGTEQDQVLTTLRKLGRKAFVLPTINGFTTFCDARAETQDPRAIEELAKEVSRDLGCPIFCVLNHDDDVLWYGLYRQGELLDEYNSSSGYVVGHLGALKTESAETLCKIMGIARPEVVARVEAVLRKSKGGDGYIFEVDRHAALVEAMGLPNTSVGTGYHYLERGELPVGLAENDIRRS